MSTTVTYKGVTITTAENQTRTLATSGKWLEADIVIADVTQSSSGTPAISVVDTTDPHGGTVREITALDISDTTAIASDVASGKYFYTANGIKTLGTGNSGGSSGYTRTIIAEEQTVTPVSTSLNGSTYYGATLNISEGFEADAEYIITFNDTEYFFTCQVLWGTNYLLGDINYFYGGSDLPYPFGIIWRSGTTCTLARNNGNQVTVKIEKLELTGTGNGTGQTATGTVTGDGTNVLEIPCNFTPDLIYVYGDMSEDVANRGVTSVMIIKNVAIYASFDSSTSNADEFATVLHDITGYNESDTSTLHAIYSNNTLTIDTATNSTSAKWRSGQVYNYELSTIGTGGGSSSPTLVTKEITANGTYTASNDSADGYSSVTVNVPSSGITPTGSINITTNGTHDVTNYASAVVNVSGGGGSSATQHSIYFEFIDSTNITVPIYYDDSFISSVITTSKPSTYNNKQVTLAQLDGTTWYSPKPIPLNTQLIDYTKMKDHYSISGDDGTEEEYEWSSVTEYIPIDRNMTFTYVNYKWFGFYFYDINKTYIKNFSPMDDGAVVDEYDRGHGTLDGGNIPQGAEYVRFVTELEANNANEASLIRIA